MSVFDEIADISLGYQAKLQKAFPGNRTIAALPDDVPFNTAEARLVLRVGLWLEIVGLGLPSPLALLVFDFSMLCDSQSAIRVLQAALSVEASGIMNQETLNLVYTRVAQDGLSALLRDFQARAMMEIVTKPIWGIAALQIADRLCGALSIAIEWTLKGEYNVS